MVYDRGEVPDVYELIQERKAQERTALERSGEEMAGEATKDLGFLDNFRNSLPTDEQLAAEATRKQLETASEEREQYIINTERLNSELTPPYWQH